MNVVKFWVIDFVNTTKWRMFVLVAESVMRENNE